jgi:hypothetical protein
MSSGSKLFENLKAAIAARKVTVVVGSGVSCATTNAPGWAALIRAGIDHCSELGAKPSWCRRASMLLGDPDESATDDEADDDSLDMLLMAAELVHRRFRSFGEGEFAGWMREQFEHLKPDDPSVIEAVAALRTSLVTTNYDDLIEKVTGLQSITWQDRREVMRDLRRDDRRVLHLHGLWNRPETVVLGLESYLAVTQDGHAQTVMKTLGTATSLLLVCLRQDGVGSWGSP